MGDRPARARFRGGNDDFSDCGQTMENVLDADDLLILIEIERHRSGAFRHIVRSISCCSGF